MSDSSQSVVSLNAVRVKIIGLGGGGSNMVSRLKLDASETITRIAVNTDAQALDTLQCDEKVLLGASITRGLGTGGELEIGERIAEAEHATIASLVSDAELIILVVGLGGGTGSSLITKVAELASQTGALTIAFATLPFSFEGLRRKQIADVCLGNVRSQLYGLIPLPNDILLQEGEEDASVMNAFAVADSWVERGVCSVCTLLLKNGVIDQDFGSMRSVFQGLGGKTLFGIGFAEGDNYVEAALEDLFLCPLLHTEERPARLDRILVNLIVSPDLSLSRINEIMATVSKRLSTREDITFGAVIDPSREQSLEICVFGKSEIERKVIEPTHANESNQSANQVARTPEATTTTAPVAYAPIQVHPSKLKSKSKDNSDVQDEFIFNQLEQQRGYFDKTDRNEYEGEDLDVPTYLRRGIKINLKLSG